VDYDFSHDEYKRPIAKFSIGHEAISRWFTEELGSDQQATASLLDTVRQSEQQQLNSRHILGAEFQLRIEQNEVEIIALALEIDVDEPIPEDTNLYDAESYAECGLQDFKQALLGWQIFIA
jgi:uncharacterized protein YacL (UPF0231 family)